MKVQIYQFQVEYHKQSRPETKNVKAISDHAARRQIMVAALEAKMFVKSITPVVATM